jgi:CubicO group peptidase (beta-lactamase class C family)
MRKSWSYDASPAVECCYAVEGEAPTVTIQEMLEAAPVTGLRHPARVTMVPGTEYRCANLGYGIVQLLIEDVTKEPFATFMQETVLDPLDMTSSTFPETGQGAVIMTNSASAGGMVRLEILLSIVAEYGWPLAKNS